MTEPYTPTTDEDPALEEVRGWYIDGRRVHNPFASDAALVERFDRWLADHDAEVAAKAWDEGYNVGRHAEAGDYLIYGNGAEPENPYRARLTSGGEG